MDGGINQAIHVTTTCIGYANKEMEKINNKIPPAQHGLDFFLNRNNQSYELIFCPCLENDRPNFLYKNYIWSIFLRENFESYELKFCPYLQNDLPNVCITFQNISPLGRCFLYVEMSVCLFVCLSVCLCVPFWGTV